MHFSIYFFILPIDKLINLCYTYIIKREENKKMNKYFTWWVAISKKILDWNGNDYEELKRLDAVCKAVHAKYLSTL